jgi:hypothetical protein
VLFFEQFQVTIPRGLEKDRSEFIARATASLDGVAVRAQRDHLVRVVGTAEGQVLYVIDLQNRLAPDGAVLDVAGATRVLATASTAQ